VIKALFARRTEPTDAFRARARQRMRKVPTDVALDWADQCGNGIVKALSDFRRDGDPQALLEAAQGVSGLAGVVDSLRERMQV
jgi:hypothetical protein